MEAVQGRNPNEVSVAPPVLEEVQQAVTRINKQLPFCTDPKIRRPGADF